MLQIIWGRKVSRFSWIDWQLQKFCDEITGIVLQDYHAAMEAQVFSTELQFSFTIVKLFYLEKFAVYGITKWHQLRLFSDPLVIVRHLIQASSRYKCLSRRWQNDIIETEAQPRFLLCHLTGTSYEGIYTLKVPCMRCLIVLENSPLCSLSLTNLS